jgi:hypothetical protein
LTIAAAITSLGANGKIYLVDGTYAETSIAIPKGAQLEVEALSFASITNQVVWTIGDNDSIQFRKIDLNGGISLKDGDAGTGQAVLVLDTLFVSGIVNGNSGSAAHTHVIDVVASGPAFDETNAISLSALNTSGTLYATNAKLLGNITSDSFIGQNVFFATGKTHNFSDDIVILGGEFETSVSLVASSAHTITADDKTLKEFFGESVATTNFTLSVYPAADLRLTSQVEGSLAYFNGTNWVQLSPSSGVTQYLRSGGPSAIPAWTTIPASSVHNDSASVTGASVAEALDFIQTEFANLPLSTTGAATGDLFTWSGTQIAPAPTQGGDPHTMVIGGGSGFVKSIILSVDDDAGTIQQLFMVQDVIGGTPVTMFSVSLTGVAGAKSFFVETDGGGMGSIGDIGISAGTNLSTGVGKTAFFTGGQGSNAVGGIAWVRGGTHSGSGTGGNTFLGGTASSTAITDLKSMAGGIWLPAADAEPTAAPASGCFFWFFGGNLKGWPAGGSKTTLI